MAEKIKLTFLGTGSAIPTPRRNHPAMLLQYKDKQILIDCGEGTQTQFRKAKINPCKTTHIIITHWHADHVLGLPGLIQTLRLNEYNKTLNIYGPRGTKKFIELYLKLFANKSKYRFKIKVKELVKSKDMKRFIDNEDFCINAATMEHDTPTIAYSFIVKEKTRLNKNKLEKLNLPHSKKLSELKQGKTIKINNKTINPKKEKLLYKEKSKKISFIIDTKKTHNIVKLSAGSNLLICESTYSKDEQKIANEHLHLTTTDAADIAKKSKSDKLILTHLSQRYDTKKQQEQLLKEAKSIFKNTIIAEDLTFLEI